jgi:hypothetical protein
LASRPSGASIEVDGKTLEETTPTVVRGLGAGPHTLRFRKGKLAVVERQVQLEADERQIVNVALPAASHRVEVRSVPEGATVYLDGRLVVGVTPTSADVSEDDFHELRVEKGGYETVTRGLAPDDKETVLNVPLAAERVARGTLFVDSNRAAAVWVDGVDTGYTTPTLGMHLRPGEHRIEVHEGNAQATMVVNLVQGQTLRLLLSPGGKGELRDAKDVPGDATKEPAKDDLKGHP